MIKGRCKSRIVGAYLLVFMIAVALGCGLREDPPEVLDLCGNHTCGDLVMITNDTSSFGYQYLEPAISPDGTRIVFTADGDSLDRRRIRIMPLPDDLWADGVRYRAPALRIEDQGAYGIVLRQFNNYSRGNPFPINDAVLHVNQGRPVWLDDHTLIITATFGNRERMLIVDVRDPRDAIARVAYFEPADLNPQGGWFFYHDRPAISPDGRWLAFTRFGCDIPPNSYEPGWPDQPRCTKQSLWVVDMQTVPVESEPSLARLRDVVAFQLTSEAVQLRDPAWSPDGRLICFAATTDLIGQQGGMITELFSIRFDAAAAAGGEQAIVRDLNLRRLTTTSVIDGDPIVGLHNYSPTFNAAGSEIYFTSTRRAPATTRRGRSIWRIPYDGRLEPRILFYSYYDDIEPTIFADQQWVAFSSRMGFPTYYIDHVEQSMVDSLTINDPTLTAIDIRRRATVARRNLQFYEDVMSHLYLYRGF